MVVGGGGGGYLSLSIKGTGLLRDITLFEYSPQKTKGIGVQLSPCKGQPPHPELRVVSVVVNRHRTPESQHR